MLGELSLDLPSVRRVHFTGGNQSACCFCGSGAGASAYIKTGSLRALAVTNGTRWDGLPDIPTVGETVPGYEASAWYGIGVPKGTPPEVVAALNRAVNELLAEPQLGARLTELGGTLLPGSPDDFARLIAGETDKWGKLVNSLGLSVD
jgi:tripartite-type tricarboxylate transporter receptor subunit TctC